MPSPSSYRPNATASPTYTELWANA
jgi:hypothetical protein